MKCYACDAAATGTRDYSYEQGRGLEPACCRHRDDAGHVPDECECGRATQAADVDRRNERARQGIEAEAAQRRLDFDPRPRRRVGTASQDRYLGVPVTRPRP